MTAHPAATVTIAGSPVPCSSVQLRRALAPEVDTATLQIPWGNLVVAGTGSVAEALPALGAAVVITSGSLTWRGTVTRRQRRNSAGRRSITVQCHGPGLAADRAYLPSFARTVPGPAVGQVAGGPRFAPKTRSASASGPGSTYYLVAGGSDWTLAQALASYLAHATYAGLPAITLDAPGVDLSRKIPDIDTAGLSYHAGIAELIGPRSGLSWRLLRNSDGTSTLELRAATGGSALDLTASTDYDVSDDASATLADLDGHGDRRNYILSLDHYTGSSGGDLMKDWTSGDETARAAGDRNSPAYRRFRLGTVTLPDGTSLALADPLPGLPCQDNGYSSAPTEGSSPWLLFVALIDGPSTLWSAVPAQIQAQGSTVWIEGIDPELYNDAATDRFRLTLAVRSRGRLSDTRTGGSGTGRGLAVIGARYTRAQAASLAVTSGGAINSWSTDIRSDQAELDDQLDAQWAQLGGPALTATWTVAADPGTAATLGQAVPGVILPVPGAANETITAAGQLAAIDTTWHGGRVVSTYTIAPMPWARSAVTR